MMLLSAQEFKDLSLPLLGLPCWHVRWEKLLNLSMHFGPPKLTIHEPRQSRLHLPSISKVFAYRQVFIQGSWFLWLELAYWKLSIGSDFSITGTSGVRKIQEALSLLDGQYVNDIQVDLPRNITTWIFDIDATLIIRPQPSARGVTWRLYTPNETVISMASNGALDCHDVDEGQMSYGLPEQSSPGI